MNCLTLQRPCGCIKNGRDGTFLHYCRKHDPESSPVFIIIMTAIIAFTLAAPFLL